MMFIWERNVMEILFQSNFLETNLIILTCSLILYFGIKSEIKKFEKRQVERCTKILDIIEMKDNHWILQFICRNGLLWFLLGGKKMFVVKCENGGFPWWLNGCLGDPGRTVLLENAERYKTKQLAEKQMKKAIKQNPFRKLENRLEVVEI